MYGQKTTATTLSTGIAAASWVMWSVTIALATAAAFLLVRVFITMRKNASQRP